MKLMVISSAIYLVSSMFLGLSSLSFWSTKHLEYARRASPAGGETQETDTPLS
jgi:hypothetical protein